MFAKSLLEDCELSGKLIPKGSHDDLFMIACKAFYCSNDQIGNSDAIKNTTIKLLRVIIVMVSNKCKEYYLNFLIVTIIFKLQQKK